MADEDFHSLIRTQGTQATRLGSDIESRFWLSYRPYESKNVAREWFIGPVLTWLHSEDESIASVTSERERRRRPARWSHHLRGRSPWHAPLAGNGLGCRAFQRGNVHADPASHQFRNHSAISAALLSERRNDEYEKTRVVAVAWAVRLRLFHRRKSNTSKCASKA